MADAIADIAAGNAADTLRALAAERLEVHALTMAGLRAQRLEAEVAELRAALEAQTILRRIGEEAAAEPAHFASHFQGRRSDA